jgi:outer membrane protein assembly factor BamB
MNAADLVLVASNYQVIALHKADGEQVWATALVTGFFNVGERFVSVALDETGVYAHTKNEMFRLDLLTGKVLWQKKLPELGRDVASVAILGTSNGPSQADRARISASRRESSGD